MRINSMSRLVFVKDRRLIEGTLIEECGKLVNYINGQK